jgi:hypothetical protein
MKQYHNITDCFSVMIRWDNDRQLLRTESGGTDNPTEMISEFQGLSPWGAKKMIELLMKHVIGCDELVPSILEELGLPS